VLIVGNVPDPDLVRVLRCGAVQFAPDVTEPLDELGRLAAGEDGHILPDQHLGVAVASCADFRRSESSACR